MSKASIGMNIKKGLSMRYIRRNTFIKKLAVFILAAALSLTGSRLNTFADEKISANSVDQLSVNSVSDDDAVLDSQKEDGENVIEETGVVDENESLSENAAQDPEEENKDENKDESAKETDEDISETVSANTISEDSISENEIVSDGTSVSENSAEKLEKYLISANEALKKVLENKVIPAVIVLCDEYGLRAEPGNSPEIIINLPVSTTVYPEEVAYEDGKFWFKVKTYVNEKEYCGYVIKNNLIYVDEEMLEWEREYLNAIEEIYKSEGKRPGVFSIMSVSNGTDAVSNIELMAAQSVTGFPASYQSALNTLSEKHPNWVFVPQNTGVSFSAALKGELSDKNKNWIYYTAPASYKNGAAAANWYYASQSCLEYYMDPRNFLSEKYIFQFETLAYNASYQSAAGVQKFLNGTFMSGTIPGETLSYAEAFAKTGAAHQVSPYHLAARVYQEQGVNGTSAIISGKYSGYEGYYNYYNIQASGSNPILNGLIYAKKMGWNTRYKSLDGGAEFLGSSYINRGQDTLYTQKYNVASSSSRYSNQYMQNAQAASTESVAIYKIYNGAGSLNDAFIFKIPVFTDMTLPSDSEETTKSALTTKPSVSLKAVRALNLFGNGTADMGVYRISTTGNIVSVGDAYISTKSVSGGAYITVDHTSGNLVYLKSVNVNSSNISQVNKNVKLSITLEGFDAADYSVKVSTKTVKPTLKLKSAVIYSGLNYGTALITDSSGNTVSLPDDARVSAVSSDINVSLAGGNSQVVITPVNAAGFKAGSRKLKFSSDEWNTDITLSVSVKKSSKPTLALSGKTVTFNTSLPDAEKLISYGVNGSSLSVNSLTVEGANAKSRNALSYGYISAQTEGDGQLRLKFNSSFGAGSYTLKLTGTIDDFGGAPYKMKSVNLSVKVVNKTPEKIVGVSQKGNVNLVNRGGTDKLFTLSRLSQIGAQSITGVSIEGANSGFFSAEVLSSGDTDDNGYSISNSAGAIAVHALDGAALSHKVKYAIPLKITLDNGYVLSKTVNIKPANSCAKLSALVSPVTITRGEDAKSCYIKSAGIGNDNTLVSSLELVSTDKNSRYFSCSAQSAEASKLYGVKLSINDETMKSGKYTLKFNVYPKGISTAAKPIRVSVKVTVR